MTITVEELVRIIVAVNRAFAAKRRAVSPRANVPFLLGPVEDERIHLVLSSRTNSNIYVKNITINVDEAISLINGTMIGLKNLRNNWQNEKPTNFKADEFDRIVMHRLCYVFQILTKQSPTKGGYKKTKTKSPYLPHREIKQPARLPKSPFIVFVLELLKRFQIRRLDRLQTKFTTAVIRNATVTDGWDPVGHPSDADAEAGKLEKGDGNDQTGHATRDEVSQPNLPDLTELYTPEEAEAFFRRVNRMRRDGA